MGQALGYETPIPEFDIVNIEEGDKIIAFSDGINGNFTDKELLEIIKNTETHLIPKKVLDAITAKLATGDTWDGSRYKRGSSSLGKYASYKT